MPTVNRTKVTLSLVQDIRSNMEKPDSKLASKHGISESLVWLIKEVKRNPDLQSRNRGPDKQSPSERIRNKIREREGLYTAEDLAETLGVAKSTACHYLKIGKVRGRQVDNAWVVREKDMVDSVGLKQPHELEDYYSTTQAAEILDYTRSHITYLCQQGEIPSEKIAGHWGIPKSEIEDS